MGKPSKKKLITQSFQHQDKKWACFKFPLLTGWSIETDYWQQSFFVTYWGDSYGSKKFCGYHSLTKVSAPRYLETYFSSVHWKKGLKGFFAASVHFRSFWWLLHFRIIEMAMVKWKRVCVSVCECLKEREKESRDLCIKCQYHRPIWNSTISWSYDT